MINAWCYVVAHTRRTIRTVFVFAPSNTYALKFIGDGCYA